MNRCPLCHRRRVMKARCKHRKKSGVFHCWTCCRFITKYIDTGLIPRRPVPMVADVELVMRELGVDQDSAVRLLGGTP